MSSREETADGRQSLGLVGTKLDHRHALGALGALGIVFGAYALTREDVRGVLQGMATDEEFGAIVAEAGRKIVDGGREAFVRHGGPEVLRSSVLDFLFR